MKKSLYTLIICLFAFTASSQLLYNNNSNIFVNTGGIMQVNGTAQNAAGTVENNGTSYILVDYINDDLTQGDGEYYVTGNWENNSVFTPQISHVYLDGVNQLITGTQVTSFYDLTTIGTGIKTQTIDSRVLNILDLTDRELATDANTMFVDNDVATAITFTTGFVSSDPVLGKLDRATNSTNTYIFPTGSSTGVLRYRPVEITPVGATANRYAVRFANFDATTEGYDRTLIDTSICVVNPNWFHLINRSSGTENADITIYYDLGTDGAWTGIAQWEMVSANLWDNVGPVTAGVPPPMESLTKAAHDIWTSEPYSLTNLSPIFDIAGTDPTGCGVNDGQLLLTGLTPNTNYTITYDSAGIAVGPLALMSDATGQITIITGNGTYTNITVDDGACSHTNSGSVVLNGPTTFPSAYDSQVDETACGASDGSIVFSGFTPGTNYTVTYTDPAMTAVNVNLVADASGNITVTGLASGDHINFDFDDGVCNSQLAGPYTIVGGTPPPAPTVNGTLVYCVGDVYTALTVTGSDPTSTFDWFDDAGLTNNIGTGTTYTPTTLVVGNNEFYVTETLAGCTSLATQTTVVLNDVPTATISNPGNITLCQGDSYDIDITFAGTPPFDLDYSIDGVPQTTITGINSTNYTLSATIAGTYALTGVANGGPCPGTVDPATVIIVVTPAPNAPTLTSASGSTTFCEGDDMTLNAAGGTGTITWFNDTGLTNPVGTGSTFDPGSLSVGTYTFYAQEEENGCTGASSDITITVLVVPELQLPQVLNICEGESVTVTPLIASQDPTWNDGTVAPSVTLSPLVDTFVVAEIQSTCLNVSDTTVINVNQAPIIDAGPDITIPLGATTQITATGGDTYSWDPTTYLSCSTCSDPVAAPYETTTYIVTGYDEYGCSSTDTITIIIDGEISIYIPNVFSPNGDGQNDEFEVYGPAWSTYSMQVYNRWGGIVFDSENPNVNWDGTNKKGEECPQAVFVYKLKGKSIVGITYEKAGNVMLTR
jgi:gliding motility-associated-like protein